VGTHHAWSFYYPDNYKLKESPQIEWMNYDLRGGNVRAHLYRLASVSFH
jgi:hypothetical protein